LLIIKILYKKPASKKRDFAEKKKKKDVFLPPDWLRRLPGCPRCPVPVCVAEGKLSAKAPKFVEPMPREGGGAGGGGFRRGVTFAQAEHLTGEAIHDGNF
jgi:hypothetical protein